MVRVMVCEPLVVPICCCGKLSARAESVSVAGALPTPESDAVWVAAEAVPALSVMERVAERAPLAVGVKVMVRVQPVEGARVAPQVLEKMAKSPMLPPLRTGVVSVAVVPPVLEMVMFWLGAVWLTMVAGKVSESGVSTMAAAAVGEGNGL